MDGFYIFYNFGYDKKGDGYCLELYCQMNEEWKKDVIFYYIWVFGFYEGVIFVFVLIVDEKGYQFFQI